MPMPTRYLDRLQGKVAIVTGGGTAENGFGIGKAIAYLFAREGARVCVVDRELELATETCTAIANDGGEALAVRADVAEEADQIEIVRKTLERWGRLDVLVNNVGIAAASGRLDTFEIAAWQRVLDVNLKAALLGAKQAIPAMIASGGGALVNIASIGGLRAQGATAYGPSKAALISLTRELAVLYGRDGIRANVIAPGHIYTPMAMRHVGEAAREARRRVTPLGIEGDPWDVASTALFLASDEARFLTSVCIPVDGGLTEITPLVGHAFLTR